MLTFGAALIIPAVALPNIRLTPILSLRTVSILLIITTFLSFNTINFSAMESNISLYNNLINVSVLSQSFDCFILFVGAFAIIPWAPYYISSTDKNITNNVNEYSLFIIFSLTGSTLLISSANLVTIYLAIELQSFGVYILAALYSDSKSATGAGLKYLILGGLSSALIIFGSAIIYSTYGITNLDGIIRLIITENSINSINSTNISNILSGGIIGLCLLGVGLLFKVSAAPFHQWAPDVYQGVPTIVTTWLAVIPKISIIGLILILTIGINTNNNNIPWINLLILSSILSLIIGTILGLSQQLLKRLLAYSTISHVGWLLIALIIDTKESNGAFLFYLSQYTITSFLTFIVILAFGYSIGRDVFTIKDLSGQIKQQPQLAISFSLCILSIAGVPPIIGFFAKQNILSVALDQHYNFLALLGIITSIIAATYYLRIIRVLYFENSVEIISTNNNQTISNVHSFIIACLTFILALYILNPSIILNSSTLLALSIHTN